MSVPKFAQQHYNAIAMVMRQERQRYDAMEDWSDIGVLDVVDQLAVALAAYFQNDNEHFDPERFFEAVRRDA